MTKKSQSALEFLTTYGWAFLVILIMIGALAYFGVLNPQRFLPDRCNVAPGVACQEFALEFGGATAPANDNGVVVMTNQLGVPIANIANCNVTYGDGSTGTCAIAKTRTGDALTGTGDANTLVPDERFFLRFPRHTDWVVGSKTRVAFAFDYTPVGRQIPQRITGEVYGTVQ